MPSLRERRIARLEARPPPLSSFTPPLIIIVHDGETQEAAILRQCGPGGLPPVPRGHPGHFIVNGRRAVPRDE